ncbi:O-antigen ligase family protein [Fictibacillus nanhaiensis]|uniref:O-antigen ligase family protein n=1 Tax=Fictibacillus nanhaiensis TaxID=742169 RepID=UPI003C169988
MTIKKTWLIIIVLVLELIMVTGINFISPWVTLMGSLSLGMLILMFKINKSDTPRVLFVALIPFLVCFNIIQKMGSMLIVGGMIGLYLLFYLVDNKYRGVRLGKSGVFFIVWMLYALLQTTWTITTEKTWLYINVLTLGIIIVFLMSKMITTIQWIELLYKWWGIALLGTILFGLWEVNTNNHLSSSGANPEYYNLQNVATVGFFNPNDYGFFLIISLPIILYWIKKKFLYKVLGLFMLGSSFYIVFQNGARFIILLYFLVIILYLLSLIKSKRNFSILLFFTFGGVSVSFLFVDMFVKSFSDVVSLASTDSSSSIRKMLFENGWILFTNNPLGVGSGNIEYYLKQNSLIVHGIPSLHNFWLEFLVTYGILIFIGFLTFYIASLIRMYKALKMKSLNFNSSIKPLFWSSLLFIPASLESSTIFTFNIIWFLFGILLCMGNIIKKEMKPQLY